MAKGNHYGIDCRDNVSDAHTIQIPRPRAFVRVVGLSEERRHIMPVNVLCPHCKHVYEYRNEDVHPLLLPDPFKDEPFCAAIQFSCDDGNCKSQLTVHVIEDYPMEISTAILRLACAIFHIRCEFGHIPRFDCSNVAHAEVTERLFLVPPVERK